MLALLALALAPQTSTWYVDDDGTAPGTGTAADPYTSIAYALAQPTTQAGDLVLVEPGSYFGEEIDFMGKDVVLRSTQGAAVTFVSGPPPATGTGATFRLDSGESLAATIEGFTIEATFGLPLPQFPPSGSGAGVALIVDSGVTFRGCVLQQTASFPAVDIAGAVLAERSDLRFEDCTFDGFHTYYDGGALALFDCDAALIDCDLQNCTADGRGGFALIDGGILLIEDCTGSNLRATYGSGGVLHALSTRLTVRGLDLAHGGSYENGSFFYLSSCQSDISDLVVEDFSNATEAYLGGAYIALGTFRIARSRFSGCTSRSGAAVFVASASGTIEGSEFIENETWDSLGNPSGTRGGAVAAGVGVTIERCEFRGNRVEPGQDSRGGAIFGAPTVRHCTFVDNGGAAFGQQVSGSVPGLPVVVESCIFVAPAAVGSATSSVFNADVRYSLVEGGAPGPGNFDGPASFWGQGDLRLLPDSAAIDAGDPLAPLDPDGTRADCGAYPFDPTICGAGCTGAIGAVQCTSHTNSASATGARLGALGSKDVAVDRLVLNATGVPANALGYFLTSLTPGSQPLGGGSQGTLCLGGQVLRFSNVVVSDRGTGTVSFRPSLADFPQGALVQPGETWNFQLWFRDANPAPTSNTSDAVSVDFL